MKYVNKQKMFIFRALDKRGSFHAAKVSIFTRMCNFFPRFIFSYCRRGGNHSIEQPCRPRLPPPLLLLPPVVRVVLCRHSRGDEFSPPPFHLTGAPSLSSHRRHLPFISPATKKKRGAHRGTSLFSFHDRWTVSEPPWWCGSSRRCSGSRRCSRRRRACRS